MTTSVTSVTSAKVQARLLGAALAVTVCGVASCGGSGDTAGLLDAGARDDLALGSGAPGCVPRSCKAGGYTCGKNSDGCGGLVDCGTCSAGSYCGGGGFSRCGTGDAGAPSGAGASASSSGSQGSSGGAGATGGSGSGAVSSTLGGGAGTACTGLCTKQVACATTPTAITGRLLAGESSWVPAGTTPDPVPNALVYVPNGTVQPFAAGATCSPCGAEVSGAPLVTATTAYDGTFTLNNVPVGAQIPVVVQLGRWRRQFKVDVTRSCATTAIGDVHLPRNESEGNIPLTAISTGAVDSIECILLKMGVDETEFAGTASGGGGRIHLYSAGFGSADTNGHGPGAWLVDSEAESALLGSGGHFMAYDQIMLPCWGDEFTKTSDELANLVRYANAGGRFFATHFSYTWLFQNSPFDRTAAWDVDANRNSTANGGTGVPFTGNVDLTSNPKGPVFARWLGLVGALSSSSPAQVDIAAGRHDVDSVQGSSVDWIDGTDPSPPSAAHSRMLLHYTFDTPVGQAAQCGHAIFSDFHVNDQTSTNASLFPDECDASALTPQERVLEYMIWDLQSCVPAPGSSPSSGPGSSPTPSPTTSPSCTAGSCPSSVPSACVPTSCGAQGLQCGPAGDGCGGVVDCGRCVAPGQCGAGGFGKCGSPIQ